MMEKEIVFLEKFTELGKLCDEKFGVEGMKINSVKEFANTLP